MELEQTTLVVVLRCRLGPRWCCCRLGMELVRERSTRRRCCRPVRRMWSRCSLLRYCCPMSHPQMNPNHLMELLV